jgi:hypothetical protein
VAVELYCGRSKEMLAFGRTDGQGEWSHPTFGPGEYEVVIDPKPGAAQRAGLPFRVRPDPNDPSANVERKPCCNRLKMVKEEAVSPAAAPSLWPPLLIGGALLGVGVVVLVLGGRPAPEPNPRDR